MPNYPENINNNYQFKHPKTMWHCIVNYDNKTQTLMFYTGYYIKEDKGYFVQAKPALTEKFEEALKLDTKAEAERILTGLEKPSWKIEEHSYF